MLVKSGLLAVVFAFAALAQTGVVEGTVVDSNSGTGIPGVSVYFGNPDGNHYETTSDASGSFRVGGMTKGEYGSHLEKDGYMPYYSGSDAMWRPVRVGFGPDVVGLRIQLSAFGSLRGRVLEPDGNPLTKAVVDLSPSTGVEVTAEDGTFFFRGVQPGSYTLLALPAPNGTRPKAKGEHMKIGPTWFPSAVQAEQAEKIRIDGGAQLAGYEIRLRASAAYRVRGTVLDSRDRPIQNARIIVSALSTPTGTAPTQAFILSGGVGGPGLFQPEVVGYFIIGQPRPPIEATVAEVTTGEKGAFEAASVRAGVFRFTVWRDPSAPTRSDVEITVDRDIDDLEIRLPDADLSFAVSGSAELQGSSMVEANWRGNVTLSREDGSINFGTLLTSDGILRFGEIRSGKYRILPAPVLPGGRYLSSVLLGDRDVTGESVYLAPGSPSIRLIYKTNGGGVRGTVENGANATIVLVPQSSLSSAIVDYGWIYRCDSDGTFAFTSLRPGTYYAWALDVKPRPEELRPVDLPDLEGLRGLLSSAVAVTIEEGGTTTADLKLTHVAE